MICISQDETKKWLQSRKIITFDGTLIASKYFGYLNYKTPSDSGRKTALSALIASIYRNEDESLLWINEFGIWSSNEDWNLFEGFRKSIGEKNPLYEKPGHLITKKDNDNLKSLLALILYFSWGAILATSTNQFVIQISHDEFISYYSKSQNGLSIFKSEIDRLGYLERT